MGEAQLSRPDYTASADDNVLVQGIAGGKYSLGYFGFAYYQENQDKLNLVAVDSGNGCVLPTSETYRKRNLFASLTPAVHLCEQGRAWSALRSRRIRGILPRQRRRTWRKRSVTLSLVTPSMPHTAT